MEFHGNFSIDFHGKDLHGGLGHFPMEFHGKVPCNSIETTPSIIVHGSPGSFMQGRGAGEEETRSGTEKRRITTFKAVTLRGGQRIIAVFPTVNIFRLFRSKKGTGRGNQKCLKN